MNSNHPILRKIPFMTCLRRVAILGLLLVAATTQAEQFGDFRYGVVGSNIQIYVYTGLGGDVVIPGEIDGMPVTTIDRDAFAYITGLTSVTIPTNVTAIFDSVFSGCTGLTTVSLSANLTTLYDGVFGYCTGLTNITVAADNPAYCSIDGVVFDKGRSALLHFPGGRTGRYVVPAEVPFIRNYAFDNCLDLTCVELPADVVVLGNYAFAHCPNLTGICFSGAPPSLGLQTFLFASNVVMYYRAENAAAWGTTFADRPTAIWPEFATAGIQPAGFVFDVGASAGQEVVLEMCPDLSSEDWTPVSTNLVSGGTLEVTIPDWASDPSRFYRVTAH
jgi:hypothetical protein